MLLGTALVIESHTILSKEAQFQKDQRGSINYRPQEAEAGKSRSGAWKHLNGHIIRLIHSSEFWSPNPNWFSMQQKWVDALEPATIAELILVDIYSKVPFPNPSISQSGRPKQHIKLDNTGDQNGEWLQKSISSAFPEMGLSQGTIQYPPDAPSGSGSHPQGHQDGQDNNNEEELDRTAMEMERQLTAEAAKEKKAASQKGKKASKSKGSSKSGRNVASMYIDDTAAEG
ncbi:hypothetical protein VP01_4654g3 [Puccinia sorghi]|uniref:Uncharacterized protein n=1 Tax=Puccinia sorghi TaxID=27349 RepID=A0A0L6UN99_9BASI|nr:hypothetical protein VP01_4654g3 [Puccinia sorghi]